MARDIRSELTDAIAARDVPALAALAYQLLGKVEHDDERRERLAEKKRLEREEKARIRASATSGMSPIVSRRLATSGDNRDTVQEEGVLKADNTPRASHAVAVDGDAKLDRTLIAARLAYGPDWPDIEAFILRRPYNRWQHWLDEMARCVGMSSQFTVADLARVCRDDSLLKAPLGSGYALRTFLTNARIERMAAGAERPPPTAGAGLGTGTGARAFATTLAAIEDL